MRSSTRGRERGASRPAGARGPAPPAGAAHDRAALHRSEPDPTRRAAGLPRDEGPRPAAPRRAPARRSARSAVLVAVPLSRRRWAAGAALGRLQPERAHGAARSHPRYRRLGALSAPPARSRQGRGGGRGRRRLEGGAVPRSRLARPGGHVAGRAAGNRRRRRDRAHDPSSRRSRDPRARRNHEPALSGRPAGDRRRRLQPPGRSSRRAPRARRGCRERPAPHRSARHRGVCGGVHPLRSLRRRGGLAARRLELHAHRRRRAAHRLARPAHAARGHDRPRAAPRHRRARHTVATGARPRLGHSRRRRDFAAAPAARHSRPSWACRRPTDCSASSTRPRPPWTPRFAASARCTDAAAFSARSRCRRWRFLWRRCSARRGPSAGPSCLSCPPSCWGSTATASWATASTAGGSSCAAAACSAAGRSSMPAGVVAYELRSSPGQRRAGLCTLVVHLGQGAGSRRALDAGEEQAAVLLAGLHPRLLEPLLQATE